MRLRWLCGLLLVALSLSTSGCPEAPLPVGTVVDARATLPAADIAPDSGDDGGADL